MTIFKGLPPCFPPFETFAQLHKTNNFVIPAKAGIQSYQWLPGYRPSPVWRKDELCKALLSMLADPHLVAIAITFSTALHVSRPLNFSTYRLSCHNLAGHAFPCRRESSLFSGFMDSRTRDL